MSCPLCKNGPGDFVIGMMLGHAWGQVVIPDLPNLNLESREIQDLLGHLVWHAAGDICMHDFLVGKVEVKETGITATVDTSGSISMEAFREFEELQGMGVVTTTIPLPDGVWDTLKKLNETQRPVV